MLKSAGLWVAHCVQISSIQGLLNDFNGHYVDSPITFSNCITSLSLLELNNILFGIKSVNSSKENPTLCMAPKKYK